MARVGLDLDGVTYRFVDALRDYIHTTKDIPIKNMPPATRWSFYEDWGFSLQEYLEIMQQGTEDGLIFWKGDMYDGCKEVIDYLYHERGDEIIFITSRYFKNIPKLAWFATYYWLNNVAGLPYTELIMSDNKFEHDLDVLFDDAPYHFEKNIDTGCGVVFDQPWNWHVVNAPRVYGWAGIKNYITETFPRS